MTYAYSKSWNKRITKDAEEFITIRNFYYKQFRFAVYSNKIENKYTCMAT
jgi:hypothetical protein